MSRHAPPRLPSSVPMSVLALLLGLATNSLLGSAELLAQDRWEGTFQGDGLTLVLRTSGGEDYTGEAREGLFRYSVQGQASGAVMEGTYSLWGSQAAFRAILDGDRLTVEADGDTYVLAREGTSGEPADGTAAAALGGGAESQVGPGAARSGSAPPVADEVDDPARGLRFRIPSGWQVTQQDEGSWALGSNAIPGILLVWELELETLDQLRAVVSGDIVDEGISLTPRGAAEEVGSAALGVEVEGTLGDAQVRGYAVGVVSPHGPGLTILAVTEPGLYQDDHRAAARELAESVRFRPPPVFGDGDWWHGALSGQRLVRMSRTFSEGAGGSTSRTVVTLCRDGRAGYFHTFQMSMSVPGVSASDSSQDEGEGRWEVMQRGRDPVLVISLSDGRVLDWSLAYQDDRIHLDGREFLRDDPVC